MADSNLQEKLTTLLKELKQMVEDINADNNLTPREIRLRKSSIFEHIDDYMDGEVNHPLVIELISSPKLFIMIPDDLMDYILAGPVENLILTKPKLFELLVRLKSDNILSSSQRESVEGITDWINRIS